MHYPSDLARQVLPYLWALGHARTPTGEVVGHSIQDRYLLHYVVKGELWHRILNKTYVARQGDACLMDLSEETVHGAGGSCAAESYWLTFNSKDMPRCFAELRADREPVFANPDRAVMRGTFQGLMRLNKREEDIAYEWRAASMLMALLAELYAVRVEEQPIVSLGAETRPYSSLVRKGIDWIIRNYEENTTLKEMCVAVGVSRSYYATRFHRETGVPPVVWLNRYRIEQAKRLLANSDKTIGEIARAVGLPDPGYFSRLFRELTSVTPRAFRKTHRR